MLHVIASLWFTLIAFLSYALLSALLFEAREKIFAALYLPSRLALRAVAQSAPARRVVRARTVATIRESIRKAA